MLKVLRKQMEQVDEEILILLKKRMNISRKMGEYKKEKNLPVPDSSRWEEAQEIRKSKASELGLGEELVVSLYDIIHKYSKAQQN